MGVAVMRVVCLVGLALVAVAAASQHGDAARGQANIELELVASQDAGNDTMAWEYNPLESAQIVSRTLEVTGRVFESCTAGDYNARWMDRSSPMSAPNFHCYMLFTDKVSWFQARRACENLGGYLATFTSEDEMNFYSRKFGHHFEGPDNTWKGPWVGFSDAQEEGNWKWVNGESGVVGQDEMYTNWYVGEPDDCCGGEDCANIAGGEWYYKWTDSSCSNN